MGGPRQLHRGGTVVLSLAMVGVGVALVVQVAAGHGGVLWSRLLLGVLFVAAGAGRLYVEARRSARGRGHDGPAGAPPGSSA